MDYKYHYRFDETVPGDEMEGTFLLSMLAVEGLHGRSRLEKEGRFVVDKPNRYCRISGQTRIGEDLHKIFSGYVLKEFGEEAVRIEVEDEDGAMRAAEAAV